MSHIWRYRTLDYLTDRVHAPLNVASGCWRPMTQEIDDLFRPEEDRRQRQLPGAAEWANSRHTVREADVMMGFDESFLVFVTPMPQVSIDLEDDLVELDGGSVVDYMHFSLAMSKSRKVARWVGWNIDGATLDRDLGRSGLEFKEDPRLPGVQLLDDLYVGNRLDRGHLARRADLLWGSPADAERANADSFYFTNITPQMDNFNQSARNGVWGRLENAVLAEPGLAKRRVSVFGGPVLSATDPPYRGGVLVPREFWKLIVYSLDGTPRARAFVVSQSLVGLRRSTWTSTNSRRSP